METLTAILAGAGLIVLTAGCGAIFSLIVWATIAIWREIIGDIHKLWYRYGR